MVGHGFCLVLVWFCGRASVYSGLELFVGIYFADGHLRRPFPHQLMPNVSGLGPTSACFDLF